ncbi:MAG: hypothetical protein U1A25_00085 [Candidatus Sungbacteria bacterium]|nr:hypothetical protein [bacterium]MDZ4260041.1 hypothetical protein [Candidatus Sungbacteria bacterium]
METQHKALAGGHWEELSLAEQLGNVGSEIHRVVMFKERDEKRYQDAIDRAFELMDLTLKDKRWRGLRLRELARVREMIGDAMFGGKKYDTTFEYLDRYFFAFAFAARANK